MTATLFEATMLCGFALMIGCIIIAGPWLFNRESAFVVGVTATLFEETMLCGFVLMIGCIIIADPWLFNRVRCPPILDAGP